MSITAVPSSPATSSALEEARETAATTRQEAAKGDQAAIRLLAKQKQFEDLHNAAPSHEPGKGALVDHSA
jgi:hypothetical protein